MRLSNPGSAARWGFLALFPAATVSGALALPVLLGLAGVFTFRPAQARQVFENRSLPLGLLAALLVWALIAAAWGPASSWEQAAKLAALVVLGLAFAAAPQGDRGLILAGGQAAVLVISALLLVEVLLDMPLNRAAQPDTDPFEVSRNINRAATVLLAILWPVAAGLVALGGRARLGAAMLVLALGGAVTVLQGQSANIAALGTGLGAFVLALAWPRLALLAVCGGLGLWLLAAPFATPALLGDPTLQDTLAYSWAARVGIWDYVCARIAEQPWLGHGFDASRVSTEVLTIQGIPTSAIPLHPHSASLQIWYELGAIGAVLAAAALFTGGRTLAQALHRDRAAAAGVAGTLAALGVVANLSYGIWQEWWVATMFVAAALCAAAPTSPTERR